MSKSKELEKRRDRLVKELEKSKERLEKQQELITGKETEIQKVEAELFTALLVENDMSFSELKELLSSTKEVEENTPPSVQLGGTENA